MEIVTVKLAPAHCVRRSCWGTLDTDNWMLSLTSSKHMTPGIKKHNLPRCQAPFDLEGMPAVAFGQQDS